MKIVSTSTHHVKVKFRRIHKVKFSRIQVHSPNYFHHLFWSGANPGTVALEFKLFLILTLSSHYCLEELDSSSTIKLDELLGQTSVLDSKHLLDWILRQQRGLYPRDHLQSCLDAVDMACLPDVVLTQVFNLGILILNVDPKYSLSRLYISWNHWEVL